MGRTVHFRWPQLNTALQVELLDDLNPQLADDLWRATPLFSIQSHAVVAGQQIYFPTRLILSAPDLADTEVMNMQPPGRINFEPYFQYIALYCGLMTEPVPAWGSMLHEGQSYFQVAWWNAVFPGLAILITVLGINLLGDQLSNRR